MLAKVAYHSIKIIYIPYDSYYTTKDVRQIMLVIYKKGIILYSITAV